MGKHSVYALVAGTMLAVAVPATATVVFLDSFSVSLNGSVFLNDTFSDGIVPPSGPNGPSTYIALGTMQEAGGRLLMDRVGAQLVAATGGGFSTTESGHLSSFPFGTADTFSITGIFDLVVPDIDGERYGVRLRDQNQPLVSLIEVVVRRELDGITRILFRNNNQMTGITSLFGSVLLDAAHDQIGLTLTHDNPMNRDVNASYFYIDDGLAGATTAVPGTSTTNLFLDDPRATGQFAFFSLLPPAAVPEPATMLLAVLGLGLIAVTRGHRAEQINRP